jgi:hypothetical protein
MTFEEFQMNGDAGDAITFAGYYIPSLLVAFFGVLVLATILFIKGGSARKYILPFTLSIICFWGIYIVSTASRYMTLALLGSESDGAAEFAYQKCFDLNLHQAIKLAVSNTGITLDETGAQNVRFYAACRIADLLVSSNQDFRNTILNKIQNAPTITPGFFGTNALTCIFYIPNREQPRLQVAEIIRHRLLELDKSQTTLKTSSNVPLMAH